MAVGERIRFFRNLRGMTQKWLGQAVGFPQKTTDTRMAQYESGKADLTEALADALGVFTMALNVPDIDTDLGFMHTLLLERFSAWQKEAEKYRNGEISKEEYDRWRYTYPEVEVQRTRDALDEIREQRKNEQ